MAETPHLEQDFTQPPSGNELPSYDDLAAQNGPNSRFGRWRGWIEKRAAERYADITQDERQRRRERGWGNDDPVLVTTEDTPQLFMQQRVGTPPPIESLHIQTSNLSIKEPSRPQDDTTSSMLPMPFISQAIPPTSLKLNQFGSRFLPHATSQIRCVLPIMGDRMLLIGHDEGLSVLNFFPREISESGELTTKGPDEAESRLIWRGECIHQMTVLEMEETGTGVPHGVVLAVVGPSPDAPGLGKDPEALRTARMYNLSALINLAKWAIAQKGAKPLDLYKNPSWQSQQSPTKRHRPQGSIARGIRSFIETPATAGDTSAPSYSNYLYPASPVGPNLSKPLPPSPEGVSLRQDSVDSTSSWDVVEEDPLRWATDFVPLATPGSRLSGLSVLSFALWCDENRKGKGTSGQLLAIATKSNIFLYETPRGERAYRFVKEFYTPLQPRGLYFIQQAIADVPRPNLDASPGRHKRNDSNGLRVVNSASSSMPLSYGTHLSLFIQFDKKAGWIRLADSAVGEVELGEDGGPQGSGLLARDTFSSTISSTTLRQRARVSFDIRESSAKWIPPTRVDVPILSGPAGLMASLLVITRGKRTHVLPHPLPTATPANPALSAVFWKSNPKHVATRVLLPDLEFGTSKDAPALQFVAFTDSGIEVQELSLGFLNPKGKGRAFPDIVRAEEDLGGDAGFLCFGGNWDRFDQLYGSQTPALSAISNRFSTDTTDMVYSMKQEEGAYGWYRKGLEDWRIFWVGGSQATSAEVEDTTPTFW